MWKPVIATFPFPSTKSKSPSSAIRPTGACRSCWATLTVGRQWPLIGNKPAAIRWTLDVPSCWRPEETSQSELAVVCVGGVGYPNPPLPHEKHRTSMGSDGFISAAFLQTHEPVVARFQQPAGWQARRRPHDPRSRCRASVSLRLAWSVN